MWPQVILAQAPDTITWSWGDLQMLLVSGIAGAFGGLVASISICRENEVHFGFIYEKVKLGVFGDMLIGFAAGVAVLILTLNVNTDNATGSFRVVPLGLLAGIAGNRLLFGMSNAFFERVMSDQEKLGSKVDRIDKVLELITEGEKLLESRIPRAAEQLFRQALELDPRNPLCHLDLAKSLRHQADALPAPERGELMGKAIQSLSKSIEASPRYNRAYYNRACYRAVAGEPAHAVMADLRRALELFPGNSLIAAADPDFKTVQDMASFKGLVHGSVVEEAVQLEDDAPPAKALVKKSPGRKKPE